MSELFPVTTLLYIEDEGRYLMIHRVKRGDDMNRGKWLGIGGHAEKGESPEECVRRECMEEAGIVPENLRGRGIVTFVQGGFTEYMFLFTANVPVGYAGGLTDTALKCGEGELSWVEKQNVYDLPIWEGDRVFFRLLERGEPYFSLKLVYDGDRLAEIYLNGGKITGGNI